VFASGSLQFGWGLDDFGLGDHDPAHADPRLQQFMRNALADMSRPEAPLALTAVAGLRVVRVAVGIAPDPRLDRVEVFRHPGADPFAPGDPGSMLVCSRSWAHCLDPGVARGMVVRYAAYDVDAWGTSSVVLSPPVVGRRRH
jgi:hypothetical protein